MIKGCIHLILVSVLSIKRETWSRIWKSYDGTVISQGVNQKVPAEILKEQNTNKENRESCVKVP